ncbi:MAG: hypothetical protein J2P32_11490 [Actinobacteria bacterium]|nr:hypothetical protein [Actinomycetota bacterium]
MSAHDARRVMLQNWADRGAEDPRKLAYSLRVVRAALAKGIISPEHVTRPLPPVAARYPDPLGNLARNLISRWQARR